MLVHDVIAAITIFPSSSSKSLFSTLTDLGLSLFEISFKTFLNVAAASVSNTLSCGLLGPDIVGTTVDISRDTVSV